MKHYNILYSVVAHEKIECVYNLYENILKFHPGLSVAMIVHANPRLYEQRDEIPCHENLIWHPVPTVKERFTSKIFLGHLENFRYVGGRHLQKGEEMSFDFFCTLASNCMFVRPIVFERIAENTPILAPRAGGYRLPDPERWMYKEFIKNVKLNEIFKQIGMEICVITHEGAYFRKNVMDSMSVFCEGWGINESIFVHDTIPAEEIILPSLEKFLTGGKIGKRYCGWIPGIKEEDVRTVIETGTCKLLSGHYNNILKIPRDMENPMRKMVNELQVEEIPQI